MPALSQGAVIAAGLQKRADRALMAPPPTVMEKTLMPEGWDPHEYSSPARYYWPDPAAPDGLPWTVKDGFPNLEAIARSDAPRLSRLIEDVDALVADWKAGAGEKYAARAALYLRAWFLDPATRMNPNFRGAQYIAGKDRGRGGGLIDFAQLHRLLDDCAALAGWPGWPAGEERALRQWMSEYLAWLDSDKGAASEARAANNHGTWFAVQRASLLVYLGRGGEARAYLESVAPRLEAGQFSADGRQPLEAARVDGISYSLYNLEAWARLAELALRAGAAVRLDGPRRATDFILPYVSNPAAWPWSQKDPIPASALDFLASAAWKRQ